MLSKKQAKIFFIGGTALTFLIFIGLTIYSFSKSNDQTNHENITEAVVRGKELWESNNCMGCHTIMGEGAYYAPELTKVLDRRGPGYVKAVLMSPVPWSPNGRKMVAYGFSAEEADDMNAFFEWVGQIDLNGFGDVVGVNRKISPLSQGTNNAE